MRKASRRILTAAVVALLGIVACLPVPVAHAQDTQAVQDVQFIAPKLSSDAPPYDEAHPDNGGFLAYLMSYLDPTGETATDAVMAERLAS